MADILDVKTAVQMALGYFQELMPSSVPAGVLLEEVELAEGPHPHWQITFSWPNGPSLVGLEERRSYKTITIDAENGQFRSMKIRPLPVPV